MLIALLTGQRGQTIHEITLDNMTLTKNYVKIRITKLLKQSRPGHHLQEMKIKGFAPDRRLCVITVLTEYIKRTRLLRKSKKLFISYVKPHNKVSKATIARWVKTVLGLSGVDTNIFKAHSTRSASTTGAKGLNVPLATILRTAGWSRDSTFSKYYDKSKDGLDFAEAIQKASTSSKK